MPYIQRADGFDGLHRAHVGDRLGGVNGIVRDRSIAPSTAAELVCWVSDLRPGDTVIDETTYRDIATRLLDESYTKAFVPAYEAAEAAAWDALRTHDTALDDAVAALMPASASATRAPLIALLDPEGRKAQRRRLVRNHQRAITDRDENRAERDAIRADRAAGRDCLDRCGRWPVAQPEMEE